MALLARFLYNLVLFLGLILLFPCWVSYLILVPKARAGFWQKLGFLPVTSAKDTNPQRIWFHAVSVGEVNAIRSLIDLLKTDTDYRIIVSTTTRTGQNLAKQLFPNQQVIYFPYDLPWIVDRVLKQLAPNLVVVAETELWPNFIDCVTRKHQIPLILVNGRLSQRSFKRYCWIRLLMKPFLRQVTHFYMQTPVDAERIVHLGGLPAKAVTVAGNLKFDLTAKIDPQKHAHLAQILSIHPNDRALTFASTHRGEDAPLLESYLSLLQTFPGLKLILAPRHPERAAEIKGILEAKGVPYSLRSELSESRSNDKAVVVLDTIGELLTVYSLSTVAVIGGSFIAHGGQNPLEALSQRVPVVFGPHMHNFSEITRLILQHQAGFQVEDQVGLVEAVNTLLTKPELYHSMAEGGYQLLEKNRGTREFLYNAIRERVASSLL